MTAIGAGAITLKVEVHDAVPQSPVAVKVNDRSAPLQRASLGSAGRLARLSVLPQSPDEVNPAAHALY